MRLLLLATALVLAACQTTGSSGSGSSTASPSMASFSGVPIPQDANVVAPGPDVPANLAAFGGRWGGTWDAVLPSLVVVESVAANGDVRGIYAWGAFGSTAPGSMRFRSKIDGNRFTWGGNTKFEFTMKEGKLHGERIVAGAVNTVVMTKVQ